MTGLGIEIEVKLVDDLGHTVDYLTYVGTYLSGHSPSTPPVHYSTNPWSSRAPVSTVKEGDFSGPTVIARNKSSVPKVNKDGPLSEQSASRVGLQTVLLSETEWGAR